VTGTLPASIRERADRIGELHRAHPTVEVTDVTHLMTEMLHIAVHGDTWARPEEPKQVWLDLLTEVITLKAKGAEVNP